MLLQHKFLSKFNLYFYLRTSKFFEVKCSPLNKKKSLAKNFFLKLSLSQNCAKYSQLHKHYMYFHQMHVDQVGCEFQSKTPVNMQ